ncbi:MAG: YihY/virulence factor BrkB family protein [Pseudomonadota bacterium]
MTQINSIWRVYGRALFESLRNIGADNLALISAGVAFYSMLSLFPALAALIAVLGLVADPVVVVAQLEEMRPFLPEDVYDIINAQVVGLVNTSTDRLTWAGVISVALAIRSARAGVAAMIMGLNSVCKAPSRNTFRHYLRAVLLTVALVGVGIVSLLSLVVVPVLLAFFPLGAAGTLLVEALRWVIAVAVLFVGIGLLYRHGPNRVEAALAHTRPAWLSVGAIFAVLFWVLLSAAFSYYVSNFGNYNQVYGSIGAVVAMLVWLWISSFLVLFGAELNVQIAQRHRVGADADAPIPAVV